MGFAGLSLRIKLIVFFLFIMLLPLGLQGYLSYHTMHKTLNERANKSLFTAASQTADRLDTFIRSNLDAICTETRLPTLIEYLSLPGNQRKGSVQEKRASATLHALKRKDELFITSYALVDPQGVNLMDTFSSNIGLNESDRDYFQRPGETGRPYVSHVEFSSVSEEANLYFSHAIYGKSNELIGILRVQFSAAVLQLTISATQGMAGEKSFAVLLDEYHIRLAQSIAPELNFKSIIPLDPEPVTKLQQARRLHEKQLHELSTNLPAFEQGLTNAGTENPYFTTQLVASGNKLHSAAVVQTKTQSWFVVFMQPQNVFFKPIRTQTRDTLILAIIIIVIAVIAAVSFAQLLANPVTRLTAIASEIASGNLDQNIDTNRQDELGQLARGFAHMQDSIRDKITELNDEIDRRNRAEETLKEYSERLEEMVEERTKELKDAQEQLVRREKLAILGHLAGGVGHELRNPLGVISNAIYYLKTILSEADENTREYLGILSSEVHNADKIVSDLLDFSRIKSVEREEIAVIDLVSQALKKQFSPLNVEVTTRIAPELPLVFVDPLQIGQVLVNLVSNACQAMPEGGRLTISAREDRKKVSVSITDTGCGISRENIGKLFEPLFTTRAKGIGLGLSVSRNLIEANGGSIEVESPSTALGTGEEGKGSTFTIILPIREAQAVRKIK